MALKLVPISDRVIVVNPGSEFEFEVTLGCVVEGDERSNAFNIYRVKGGEWQLTQPFPIGSAFTSYQVSDPT